jgi:hypothetical protein
MPSSLSASAALTAALVMLAASSARAQVPVLGVAGGLAVPTSHYSETLDVGFTVMATAELRPVPGPLEFRGDVFWSRFGIGASRDGSSNIVGGTLDAVLDVPTPGATITPYVLGGAGFYNVESGFSFSHHSRFGPGLNFGGGIRFLIAPMLHAYIEGRYHVAYASPLGGNATYVPIVVGLRLR